MTRPQTSGYQSWRQILLAAATIGVLTSEKTVAQAPVIVRQPASQMVAPGSNVTFSVVATGAPPLNYYWVRDYFTSISYGPQSSITITNAQPGDAGTYIVYISTADYTYLISSEPAELIVLQAPSILTQPAGKTALAGSYVTNGVYAVGGPPPSYQWRLNGSDIPGANSNRLALPDVQSIDAGDYTVVATNFAGSTTSAVAPLVVIETLPVVNTMLKDKIVISGIPLTLSSGTYGSRPITYQWTFNGLDIPGATNRDLNFAEVQMTNAGEYRVTISNALGTATNGPMLLRVKSYPKAPLTMVVWGDNRYGQLNFPQGLTNVVGVAGGNIETLFLRNDGTIGDFGSPLRSDYTPFQGVVDISVGTQWGGSYGLLLGSDAIPVGFGVTWLSGANDVPGDVTNIISIAAGTPALGLRFDGTLTGWLRGLPDNSRDIYYGILPFIAGQTGIVDVAINGVAAPMGEDAHCLLLKSNGTVLAWGSINTVPPGLTGVGAIATGAHHNLALRTNGVVVAWGDNTAGQATVPIGLSNVMAIAAGETHSLALQSNGTVVAWGDNSLGQCNIPNGLSNVVSITAGHAHNVVLTKQPGVAIPPTNRTIFAGGNVTFSVTPTGYTPMYFQWQFNGTNILGATNAVLALTNVSLGYAGNYQCILSNNFGLAATVPVTLQVLRTALHFEVLSASPVYTNGNFVFVISQLSGHGNIIISASTNLSDWVAIFTNPPTIGSLIYIDSAATDFPSRFYRAVEQ